MSHDATGDDGAPSDPWLRQALRHAPDVDAAPPAELREAILRKASAASPVTRAQPSANAWARLLAWLARPAVAAGFASVAVSVVLTTLWSTGSLDEGRGVEPVAALPPPAPASDASGRPAVADAAALSAPAETPRTSTQAFQRDRQVAAKASAPAGVAAASPPAPAAPRPIDAADAPAAKSRSVDAAVAERRESAQAGASAEPVPAERRTALLSARRTAEAVHGDPLQALTASGSEALGWRVAGRTYRHDLERRTWLDRLSAAAAGQWQRSDGGITFDADATRLEVVEGGAPRGELVIGARQAWWTSPGQSAWVAPLDEAVARQLRAQAAGW